MQLSEFIKKQNIKLDHEILELCNKGIEIMSKSKDPLHSPNHVNDLLLDLDEFLKYEKNLDLNFSILLPLICWHDVWKSQKQQATNLLNTIYNESYEGIGSSKMFLTHIKNNNIKLNSTLQNEISKGIKSHALSGFKLYSNLRKIFFKIKNVETKVLIDIDQLDIWSNKRMIFFKNHYMKKNKHVIKSVRKLYFLVNNNLLGYDENIFYFNWSKNQFKKRKEKSLHNWKKMIDKFN